MALAGVVVGVLLEPVKAFFAANAARRAACLDQCARLIQAASTTRPLLLAVTERRAAGDVSDDPAFADLVARYRTARQEVRQSVALLHLRGSDRIAAGADRVREADRRLREAGESDGVADVRVAGDLLEEEILRFAALARKHIRTV